jgi:Threonine synthase N terminus
MNSQCINACTARLPPCESWPNEGAIRLRRSVSLRYVSTRGGVAPCSFEEALFAGLAADGGLYVPERWQSLERDDLAALQGASYQGGRRARSGALRRERS